MSYPTILLDVDEVVADLLGEWLRRYNLQYEDNLTPDRITDWNLVPFVKPECGSKVYEILGQEDIYDNVQPIPGALEGIQSLREVSRVVFVTSANVATMRGKVHWLERHGLLGEGPRHEDLIIAHDKSMVRGDLLIDDAPHNIQSYPGRKIVFDRPHNRNLPARIPRAQGWSVVPRLVAAVLKYRV